ncbi:MAG: DUF3685 domain-containing protein, partial [Cyanobacteriota bacterium]|nr:DUF3685 domain-containing protein [Cyanobacteriota bacterium]
MTVQPGRRLLLIGSGWGAESLSRQLSEQANPWQVTASSGRQPNTTAGADLLLWLLQEAIEPKALEHELALWRQHWPQTPLLLVLPAQHRYQRQWLLERSVEGLLDQPAADAIAEALEVLAAGGRVIELQPEATSHHKRRGQGLGHRLLSSGVDQIERELEQINAVLQLAPIHPLQRFVLEGRRRELRMAREVLHVLWGQEPIPQAQASAPAEPLQIVLANRKGLTVLHTVEERLAQAVASLDEAQASPLLALEALLPERRRQLFEALLLEFRLLVERLQDDPKLASSLWSGQQPLLRERALQQLVGAYTQLPREGALVHLGDALVSSSDLQQEDPELADLLPSLLALIEGRPLLIDGGLQAPDEPAALLHLQRLVSNWLIRNGELISRELLNNCSGWPELRRAVLLPDLLATRQLDQLRNRINSAERWHTLVERPLAIYESRRLLFDIQAGRVEPTMVCDLRDAELRQLSWWQQAFTLLLEVRDALAPQVELLINRVGGLMVLLLTRVVGRAIGLVGRGVMQG